MYKGGHRSQRDRRNRVSKGSGLGIVRILWNSTKYGIIVYKMEKNSNNHCSVAVCSNRHQWPLTIALGKCPGCGGLVVARKLENCPNCNEPADFIDIRIDHMAGNQIGPACQGTIYSGYSGNIRLERTKGEQEKLWEATLQHKDRNPEVGQGPSDSGSSVA